MAWLRSKLFKWFLLGIAILLVLLAAGLGIAFYNLEGIIQANRDRILAQVNQVIGREVTVKDLQVNFWPGVQIELIDVVIEDDASFSEEPFLTAASMDLSLRFWPLLEGNLDISNFTFQQPSIQLIQNNEGQYNFASLIDGASSAPAEPTVPDTPAEAAGQVMALSVDSLEINDGALQFINQANDEVISVKQINLRVNDFAPNAAFPIQLSAALFGDQSNFTYQGSVGPLTEPQVDGTLTLSSLPIEPVMQWAGMQDALPETLQIEGALTGRIPVQGGLEDLSLEPELDGQALTIHYPNAFTKPAGEPLTLKSQASVTAAALTLSNLQIQTPPFNLSGAGTIAFSEDQTTQFSLSSEPFALTGAAEALPALQAFEPEGQATLSAVTLTPGQEPMVDGTLALNNASLLIEALPERVKSIAGEIAFTESNAQTQNLTAQIGESPLSINANVTQFFPPTTQYQLTSERLRLRDVVEREEPSEDILEGVETNGTAVVGEDSTQVEGTLYSAEGRLQQLSFTDLRGDYRLADQVFNANNVNFQTLNGNVDAQITYDMRQDPPAFEIKTQAQQIDLAQYFQQSFIDVSEFARGTLDFSVDLQGQGNEWSTIQPSLQGSAEGLVVDGMLMNVNVADRVLGKLSQLPIIAGFKQDLEQQYPALFDSQHTVFDRFELKSGIEGGTFNLEPVILAAQQWGMTAQGSYQFDQGLRSDALLQLSQGMSQYLVDKVNELRFLTDQEGHITVPFSLQGALTNLTPAPNQTLVQNLIQKAAVGGALDGIMGQQNNPFSGFLRGALDQALGGETGSSPAMQNLFPGEAGPTQAATETAESATPRVEQATPRTPSPEDAVKDAVENIFQGIRDR